MSLLLRLSTPAVTSDFFEPVFPDRATRLSFQPRFQQALAFVALVSAQVQPPVTYPDRATFASRLAALASGTFSPPLDTNAAPLDWLPRAPDSSSRPRADWRGGFALASQPEDTRQLDWSPRYPDRIARPRAAWIGWLSPSLAPEHSTSLDSQPLYPTAVSRPRTDSRGAFAFASQPEDTRQLDWAPSYPASVRRPGFLPSPQRVFVFDPQPEEPVAFSTPVYPARVSRPSLHPSQHPFTTELAVQPDEAPLDWQAFFPASTRRPLSHPTFFLADSLDPAPERADSFWTPFHPDRLSRPSLPTSQHPFSTELATGPDEAPLDWQAFFPVSASRPHVLASEQLFVSQSPVDPIPTPPPPPPPPAPRRRGGGGSWWEPLPLPPPEVECVLECVETPAELVCVETCLVPEEFSDPDGEPSVAIRQSTYNFSADVPELTRGRIVRVLELAEEERAAPWSMWALRSADEALVLYGPDKAETHLRQVTVDFWFDSEEERDRLVALAEKNDFLKLSLERNYARLAAPPDPAFLEHALARIAAAQAALQRASRQHTAKVFLVGVALGTLLAVVLRRR